MSAAESADDLPQLPWDAEDGPVFKEPWEATAFAMAVRLVGGRQVHLVGVGRLPLCRDRGGRSGRAIPISATATTSTG